MQALDRFQQPAPGDKDLIEAARREARELARSPLHAGSPPADIPGFTILREIGRGGMGVIYEARQQNPQRLVALKVMRAAGGPSKHRLRLFRQEVQTLARLNCPNIAAIYGAGSVEDGRHYFAMELVRGVPLTEYIRQRRPSLAEHLRLFRKVCDAVHYAHQRGVIHRDLKPSNILVDENGNPKVLDFGLARIEDADEAAGRADESGRLMGTLPYMSPEQVDGRADEIDTRTDIYSLGVILYETLTGQLPYDLSDVNHEQARKIIREQPPVRPSTLPRWLRGDLEAILLKALEKDPARRYASAAALGDDLERFLTNQPVQARPLTAAYQLRKLVARHKALPAYVITLFALVSAFAVWMTILYGNAEAARSELEEQRRLVKVALARARLAEARIKEEAEAARQALEEQRRAATASLERARNAELRAADGLENQAEMLMLGQRDLAGAETLLREVLELRRLAEAPGWQRALTTSRLGECLVLLDRQAEAEPLLLESYAILAATFGDFDPRTIEALHRIVLLYASWNQPEEARSWREKLDAAIAAGGG